MKNYKIIESRPELNATQLEQGMDFAKIKSKAALVSKAGTATVWSVKGIILNSIAGAVLIGGTVFGIQQFNKTPKKETMPMAQTIEKKAAPIKKDTLVEVKEAVNETSVSTPTKSPVKDTEVRATGSKTVETVKTPGTVSTATCDAVGLSTSFTSTLPVSIGAVANSVNYTYSNTASSYTPTSKVIPFRQSENATFKFMTLLTVDCYNLKKENFATGIVGTECDLGCEFKYINCDGLSQIAPIRVARLTITDPKTKLVLKTNFENIKLIHGKTTSHPIAIYLGDVDPETKEPRFLHYKFRSKRATLKLDNKVDIIMIIKEPFEAGDKLIFDNIRAVISE